LKQAFLAAPFLIGSWFGTGQPDDKGSMWLTHQAADGNFSVLFRTCVRGKNFDELETGRWILNGDTETLQVRTVNGQAVSQNDNYRILSHDGAKQVYRFLGTGFVYSSKRVDGSFEMPDCQLVS
jgi:hypothetical protein